MVDFPSPQATIKYVDKKSALSDNFPKLLAVAVGCAIAWSAVEPYSWGVWCVEISSVLLVYFILIFTYGKFRFSNMSYFIVSLWLVMHAVGARYSFELVPFGFVSDLFGFERNHYDRVAHFVVGMNSYGAAEFFMRRGFACGRGFAAFAGILFIMALANAWELIEWGYAEVDGGEVGAAFLGSQGDIWDAQKDMLCDTLGAIFAAFIFLANFKLSAEQGQ